MPCQKTDVGQWLVLVSVVIGGSSYVRHTRGTCADVAALATQAGISYQDPLCSPD
jgi:hypothetical protein